MLKHGKYNEQQLLKILNKSEGKETTNVEFKRQWIEADKNGKQNKREIETQTIPAMLNIIENDDDAFIFIGVNNNGEIVGLKDEELKDDNHFNNIPIEPRPQINLTEITTDGKKIQVISIVNRYGKPYFMKKDGQDLIKIRKNSSCTTPNSSDFEALYRYRLRIDESYLSKFIRYITDYDNWRASYTLHEQINHNRVAYYIPDPSFQLIATRFHNREIKNIPVGFKYNGAIIYELLIYIKEESGGFVPGTTTDINNPLSDYICKIFSGM